MEATRCLLIGSTTMSGNASSGMYRFTVVVEGFCHLPLLGLPSIPGSLWKNKPIHS